MQELRTFVIVGAGLAGAKAAEALRAEGFEGRVVLIGEEPVRPYERPPLSKEYLRGEKGFDDTAVHPAAFYDDQGIELRTATRVARLVLDRRAVVTEDDEEVVFDGLLLATGSAPRRLPVPGAELSGVHYLRTAADADALRRVLSPGVRVVVVGAGWIGCEVAASARQLGAEVTLIERTETPLEAVLGASVGAVFSELHAEHGVDLRFGTGVEAITGAGAVAQVRLGDGATLDADLVVVGVGATPRTGLAEAAGLRVADGVLVDRFLATEAPGIYAAGDIARVAVADTGDSVRVEHWAAALAQGPVAAANMLGNRRAYDEVPLFFSDQYDFAMEYRGIGRPDDEVVFRGDPGSRTFLAFWLRDGIPVAAMNANVWDAGDALEALLRAGARVERRALADPDVELASLTPEAGSS